MVRKSLSVICIIVLIFSLMPAVFAEDVILVRKDLPQGGMQSQIGEEIVLEGNIGVYSAHAAASEVSLYDVLEEGMRQHQEIISLTSFGYENTDSNKNMILDTLSRVLYENYDILSFTGYYPVAVGNVITGISPMYIFSSLQEDISAREAMDEKIDQYIELAKDVPDTVGKILVIHDAFSKDNEYATEEFDIFKEKKAANQALGFDDKVIFTPYGALINERSVCQGISITLAAIYNKMGIETGFCKSDEINHMWNLVKVDGKWYQLDATWNDPDVITGTNSLGENILAEKCFHDYFLLSDAAFEKHGDPAGWEYYTAQGKVSCNDNTYQTGRIYNGQYVYNNENYGGWYGNIGYKNGRYIIDVWAVWIYIENKNEVSLIATGFEPFYSKRLEANIIASEIFDKTVTTDNGDGTTSNSIVKNIRIFATSDVASNILCRYATYQGSKMTQSVTRAKISGIAQTNAGVIRFPLGLANFKVFFWELGTLEPVCEARSVN